jgi:hypothetical protein
MTIQGEPMRELPRYRSHKVVHALKIAAVEIQEDGSGKIAPVEEGFGTYVTKPGWCERFKSGGEDLGYLVVYGDGYQSWSPTEAFEDGYTKL